MVFGDLPYSNLEEPDVGEFAASDPKGFLKGFPNGGVIDEFQRAPELTFYIQVIVDAAEFEGTFVLTGSQDLAIRNTVSQSLAGRTALVCLLPFSYPEIVSGWGEQGTDELIYRGFYPRIYDRRLHPTRALADYVGTYVERELRQLSLIRDLALFQRFLRLCAGLVGQLLNLQSLGNDTGVSQTTAREWLSLLEASHITFRLPPFFGIISKRLIKSPKLYFYDVGLAACLMGITEPAQLASHPLRSMLYENLIIMEVMKHFVALGHRRKLHFYRDSNGNEVDLVIPRSREHVPVEIKSAETVSRAFFKGLNRFSKAVPGASAPILVHAGSTIGTQLGTHVTNLPGLPSLLATLYDAPR